MADLKEVYGAVSEETALYALEEFKDKWGQQIPPRFIRSWEANGQIRRVSSNTPMKCVG